MSPVEDVGARDYFDLLPAQTVDSLPVFLPNAGVGDEFLNVGNPGRHGFFYGLTESHACRDGGGECASGSVNTLGEICGWVAMVICFAAVPEYVEPLRVSREVTAFE